MPGYSFISSGNGYTGKVGVGISSIVGPTGSQGLQGLQGVQGSQGAQGSTGSGFTSIINPVLDRILISTGNINNAKTESTLRYNNNKLIIEGNINTNILECISFTGECVRYLNSKILYEESVDKIVCITVRSTGGNYYVGSGFFVSNNGTGSTGGYIITASHVISDPDISGDPICSNIWIHITYPENRIYKIDNINNVVIGYDKISDVALLRINVTGHKVFEIKDSRNELKIGDNIITIGYPGGLDNQSISKGVVRDNKSQIRGEVMESISTDISIYGGNSGGPLITEDSKVVGIVSYGYTNTGEEINGGVSSYLFSRIINYYIINYSGSAVSYPKGYLGIRYEGVNIVNSVIFGLDRVEGYYVTSLDGTISPSKFNINDIITEVNGTRVGIMNNMYPLFTEIHLRQPGTVITVKYRPVGSYNIELTKNVTLNVFNPVYDYLFSNYHREAVELKL